MSELTRFSPENISQFVSSYSDFAAHSVRMYVEYQRIMNESISSALNSVDSKENLFSQDAQDKMRKVFDNGFRGEIKKEQFSRNVSKWIDSWLSLSQFFGIGSTYQRFVDVFSSVNKVVEPLRDNINRSDAEIIRMDGRFHLLHYKSEKKDPKKAPLLIVYSLINRHYILDLLPEVSIVKHFLDRGYDVYATDWETPTSFDHDLTLENYIHEYLENSVNKVRHITGSKKVSLFGYCWGGIFSLIYSAMHPEQIKNLILHATPLDLEKPDTVIENWAKNIDPEKMVDVLGNIPGQFLNFAFLMRNPLEAILKYPNYFKKPRNTDEVKQFAAIEGWLYDSRPIIGEVYKEIIKKVYQKNELIQNKMMVGKKKVSLDSLTMPVLNIVGLGDDLVPPDSTRYAMCEIPSKDKDLFEFQTGHVGLCIGKSAHANLWPKVVDWLDKRSKENK